MQTMVVKIGSSSITDGDGRLSVERLQGLVAQLAEIQLSGRRQVVLVSSGAVAAGIGKLGWRRTNITMPEKQAAAAVGQGVLMHTYEQLFGAWGLAIGQVLLTRSDTADRSRFVHVRNTLMTLLHHGIIPIVNENDTVAVDEIRFGDNDTLASLVALVTEADELVLLTDVDGLYTGNPATDPLAVRISDVWEITEEMEAAAGGSGSRVGTGGMRTKVGAAKIAVAGGCDVVVASSAEPGVLLHLTRDIGGSPDSPGTIGHRSAADTSNRIHGVGDMGGAGNGQGSGQGNGNGNGGPCNRADTISQRSGDKTSVGTRFHAKAEPVSLRKAWLIHGSRSEGELVIDDGAVRALRNHAASLLLPGVREVKGEFREGAAVDLVDLTGSPIARGIVSFSARDLEFLIRRQQSGERLTDLPEVVHRNDMALVDRV
ncbi:glutamate 5-kinase [Alicyclobacillus ferrooxydans]|uniref:Glutamate 5-kinase n=1 Tax=Alicyclobacillus ferrooxydans TaxID=471514 RepID=A0A0P9EI30_9BACL|nr:glutamate 5-kinase [Alicyclobacillus ferrooxydans]KPV42391.1 hypothetical protein AN477_17430 [Alicyclobacillus ferrooxydans]